MQDTQETLSLVVIQTAEHQSYFEKSQKTVTATEQTTLKNVGYIPSMQP